MAEPMQPAPAQPKPRPVFARHAASLLVVREAPGGPEVLMGIRAQGHRFMPNRLVFPGGSVDRGDATAAAATEPRPEVMALLTRPAGPRLARAIVLCAARELQEETGVSLGTPPSLDGIEYLCRAVTPPESPVRFNARFLVVAAERVSGTPTDSHELQEVGFRAVASLAEHQLALVTREVLARFTAWRAHRTGHVPAQAATPAGASGPGFAKLVYRRQRWISDL